MTDTGRWLDAKRRALTRWEVGGAATLGLGLLLVAFAVGALFGRVGLYRAVPAAAFAAWTVAVTVVVWTWRRFRRRRAAISIAWLAERAERTAGLRGGSVAAIAAWQEGAGSAALAAAHDRRTLQRLTEGGWQLLSGPRRAARRAAARGGVVLALGTIGFGVSGALHGAGADSWNPVGVVLRARGPVKLELDRVVVPRGDTVTVRVTARGRASATLWVRAPGERWNEQQLVLDSAGEAAVRLGPLESDRFVKATSGGRSSPVRHVDVLLPAFLSDLQLTARYPDYLDLPDELLVPGEDVVLVPAGTQIETRGRATTELARAAWYTQRDTIGLNVSGTDVSGSLLARTSGRWTLRLDSRDGMPLEGAAPALNLLVVADSVPVVAVPVPGVDTVAPLSLRQPLVIDARDDHQLTAVEIVTWRISRLGVRDSTRVESVALPESGTDRQVVHELLDLNGRGLLPGDTLAFLVRAQDNAPTPHVGSSPTYRLRLPSMAELRSAMRDAAAAAQGRADSLAHEQGEVVRQLEDLAAERQRGSEIHDEQLGQTPPSTQMPFASAEQARGLLDDQQRITQRAEALRNDVRQLADAAWQAGLTDPEFQRQLRELQQLLDKALTDDMAKRLAELKQSLDRLDAPAVRDALERLAAQAQQLREDLERTRELFQRAALEGGMTSLAQDAQDLAERQGEWNQSLEERGGDSASARSEQGLQQRTEQLAAALAALQAALDSAAVRGDVTPERQRAGQAAQAMSRATEAARGGDPRGAKQGGQAASQALDPVADALRQERDRLRDQWRREVAGAVSSAMVESAELARAQQRVAARMRRGEAGAEVRGEQAALREGVDQVLERIQGAAGKNALIPPQLGRALGYAKNQMGEALDQLQRANPSPRDAASAADDAVDALNASVYALLRAQSDVNGAQSGSGLQEALEQMAKLAEQQGGLNAEAGGLLSLLPQGGQELMQRLQALAQQQRGLGDQLQRLDAQGNVTGADQLAEQAHDIARDLEAGQLDRETVERQEQLFRHLLDAGRTLQSDEEDRQKDRVSRTADPNVVQPPPATMRGDAGAPLFRYPSWDELHRLSPEERRLILDYFRRLNEQGGHERP